MKHSMKVVVVNASGGWMLNTFVKSINGMPASRSPMVLPIFGDFPVNECLRDHNIHNRAAKIETPDMAFSVTAGSKKRSKMGAKRSSAGRKGALLLLLSVRASIVRP